MQIKKVLSSMLVASAFVLSGTGALAAVTNSTLVGTNTCASCSTETSCTGSCGITCPDMCSGIGNYTTGANSENKNITDINSESNIVVENEACADDEMMFAVDTGIGRVANNTVVGSLSGGDITGNVTISQDLNNGTIAMSDTGSHIVMPSTLANAITGANSTNINKVRINDVSNTIIRNEAEYDGNYNFDLNTGNGVIGSNTVVGNVSTGDADVSLTEDITLNHNAGNIVLPAAQTIVIPDMGNSVTGSRSTNINKFNVDSSRNVEISNEAEISNNVNANINTGNNTIRNNTCVGDVSTGDVRFNVNISSSAN